jgi:hypothetical protein
MTSFYITYINSVRTSQETQHSSAARNSDHSITEAPKSLRINVECNGNFQIRGQKVEEVEKFTYIGKEVARDGGTETDVRTRALTAN